MEEKFGDRKFGLRQARVKTLNVYSNQGDGKKKVIKENGITKQNGEFFQGRRYILRSSFLFVFGVKEKSYQAFKV